MLPAIVQAAESVTTKSISDPTFETVQATRVLSDILKQAGSDHEAIILIGSDGAVCADGANGLHKGINAADREYFKAAMLGKTSVGTVVKSKSTGDPVVPVCTPVFSDSDKPVGALLIVLKPDFFIHINKTRK
ncbi:MAG: hypothetical protein HC887_05470 [Desulfobacteraceae bacterium]|nr:hypothetical protein [Desulfobacteraceae bacterium]